MSDKTPSRELPSDIPDHHTRQSAHLRVLASNATTAPLKARLLEIDSGTYVGRQAEGTTVREVLGDLRRDYEIHKRASFRTITGHIAALNAEIGDERCVNVTLPLLNRLVQEWQAAKRADATINRLLGTLRHAMRLACDARLAAVLPRPVSATIFLYAVARALESQRANAPALQPA